jgi:hypothetical protein
MIKFLNEEHIKIFNLLANSRNVLWYSKNQLIRNIEFRNLKSNRICESNRIEFRESNRICESNQIANRI